MIRPFRFGDIFLIQSLGRQITRLNTIQALLQPYSVLGAALTSAIPWNETKVNTYVLQRQGHELARSGFLQAQKRPGRPEADILVLAPALDTVRGHPAIWEKLLSHYIHEASRQQLSRIYVDAPDQPLPVKTFNHVGFKVYTNQTIWRLSTSGAESFAHLLSATIRPQNKVDEWALEQLYRRVTPKPVQQAEGFLGDSYTQPPILDWWQTHWRNSFVVEEEGEIQGCIRIGYGQRGVWLQLWADTGRPDGSLLHQLIRYALTEIRHYGIRLPVYIGVRDYHGALGAILADYGFVPFTDRAKMVKHLVQWVKSPEFVLAPALESVAEVAPAPFVMPEQTNGFGAHHLSPDQQS